MQELGSIQNVGNALEKLLLTLLDDGWRDDAPHRSAFLMPRCSCVANWKNQTATSCCYPLIMSWWKASNTGSKTEPETAPARKTRIAMTVLANRESRISIGPACPARLAAARLRRACGGPFSPRRRSERHRPRSLWNRRMENAKLS